MVSSHWRRAGGVTLVELVVVLAVLMVLAAGALHYSPPIFATARLAGASNGFRAHLALVRSEAVKRNAPVTLCKSRDGEHCETAGGWEQGWIAFHDPDSNGLRAAGEPVILRASALPAGLRLSGNGSMARYVSFDGTGTTQASNGAFLAGTLTLCQASALPVEGRKIVINAAGRARVQKVLLPHCG